MAYREALAALLQQVQNLQEQPQAQQLVIKNQEQQLHEQQQGTQNEPHSSDNSAQPRSGHVPQSSASAATADTEVCCVAIKLPLFWAESPEVWFAQVEAQFSLARITQDRTRYDYVVAHLGSRYAAELRDVLANLPVDGCYLHLKRELIRRLSPSEDEKVRQLLQHEALGDRKPSQLLRFMHALAGSTPVDDSLLRIMWLDRLPSHAQAILQVQPNLPLDQLAEIADRVVEASPSPPPPFVHATGAPQPIPELGSRIDEIARQVDSIQRHLDQRPTLRPGKRPQS
ncbi:uncharacterized protein LOC119394687 [Rhipicephalus sanguineus]|uniref:uncharacterized protein LOC119394687 n=1 Tax=Rhipicephalus sanguineus TaxID=34632 RepID=UPI001894604F|nr:uncharacterized protein LOC119394687 [Rhipicephalus sanguineus]